MWLKKSLGILLVLLMGCAILPPNPKAWAQAMEAARAAADKSPDSHLKSKASSVETLTVKNRNPRTNIKIRLRTDRSTLNPGDELHFTVETDRDCYLTLLYPSSKSDKITVVWPNKESGWNSRVKAGRAMKVPAPGGAIQLRVDGRSPFERILAVASSEPDSIVRDEDYIGNRDRPVRTLSYRSSDLVEELRNRIERLGGSVHWGTAQLTVRVASARTSREAFVSTLSPKDATVLAVKNLNALIAKKGYDWTAGVTSLSELSDRDLRIICGVSGPIDKDALQPHLISKEEQIALQSAKATRPAKWDWRNVNGKDWTTPIRDQLVCGSCVAFATAAVVEMNYQIYHKNASSGIQLSTAQLFFCGCGRCCDKGWRADHALNFVQYEGLLPESAYPYLPIDQNCRVEMCPPLQGEQSRAHISKWTATLNADVAKTWLSTVGPLLTAMIVFDDFKNYKNGVYKPTSDKQVGRHAIALVGYDDDGKFWICKNSWGAKWGENGWFKMAYDQCGIGSKIPFVKVELQSSGR
jgi:C1A family cysteine protease